MVPACSAACAAYAVTSRSAAVEASAGHADSGSLVIVAIMDETKIGADRRVPVSDGAALTGRPLRVGVIGAGIAGLATTKVLRSRGHDVLVVDRTPDVGGVWSASRRYPGVSTQNNKGSYAFSDMPMPADYPEWPSGEQVQRYLAAYAERAGLGPSLRLRTEVVSAVPLNPGWRLSLHDDRGGSEETVDHLVVANGVFSSPQRLDLVGAKDHAGAGGRVLTATEVRDVETARGAHVVVVGYGRTACDLAVALSDVAASTHVVARRLLWKVPRRIAGVLNYKYLLLTRLGEGLFRYQDLRGVERLLHGPADRVRHALLASLGKVSVRQLGLDRLGLVPPGTMEDIIRGGIGLASEGFAEWVADGRITVHRDRQLRFLLGGGAPRVELDDGTVVPADLVITATGYDQRLPFLDDEVLARLTDEAGDLQLYRQLLPVAVDDLTFAGYNSSFFCPLGAEIGAHWTAELLAGRITLPPREQMRAETAARLAFLADALDGHHARGGYVLPFSMHQLDEMLADLGTDVGRTTRLRQWLLPVDPSAYRSVTANLAARGDPAPV